MIWLPIEAIIKELQNSRNKQSIICRQMTKICFIYIVYISFLKINGYVVLPKLFELILREVLEHKILECKRFLQTKCNEFLLF